MLITQEWNKKTETTDLILTLTQKGKPTPEIDTKFIQPTFKNFNGKDKIRAVYKNGEYVYVKE